MVLYSFKGVLLPSHQHGPKVFIIESTQEQKTLIQVLNLQFKSLADIKVTKSALQVFQAGVYIPKVTLAQALTQIRVTAQKLPKSVTASFFATSQFQRPLVKR